MNIQQSPSSSPRMYFPAAKAGPIKAEISSSTATHPKDELLELTGKFDASAFDAFSETELRELLALARAAHEGLGRHENQMGPIEAVTAWARQKSVENKNLNTEPATAKPPDYLDVCRSYIASMIRNCVSDRCLAADLLSYTLQKIEDSDMPSDGLFLTKWTRPFDPDHLPECAKESFEKSDPDLISSLGVDFGWIRSATPVQLTAVKANADKAASARHKHQRGDKRSNKVDRNQHRSSQYQAACKTLSESLSGYFSDPRSNDAWITAELMNQMPAGAAAIDKWLEEHPGALETLSPNQKLKLTHGCFLIFRKQDFWRYKEAAAVILRSNVLNQAPGEASYRFNEVKRKINVTGEKATPIAPSNAKGMNRTRTRARTNRYDAAANETALDDNAFTLFLAQVKAGVLQGTKLFDLTNVFKKNMGKLSQRQLEALEATVVKRPADQSGDIEHDDAWSKYVDFMALHGMSIAN